MTSHRAHTDNLDNLEQIQSMGRPTDSLFETFFGGIHKEVDHAVEQRLKKGDYVAPPNQPNLASAADHAVTSAMNSEVTLSLGSLVIHGTEFEDKTAIYGGGLDGYADLARAATRNIDSKEREIGRKHWAALSPSEQRIIKTEKADRENYDFVAVYHSKYNPPATPHLNAFTKGVEAAIAPLERERQATLHKVWHDLPAASKAGIYRSQEEQKRIHFS